MKILFITLACGSSCDSANQRNYKELSYGSNAIACLQPQRVLPIQLLAIVGDLMDAGHTVLWPDESLHHKNKDRLVAEAQVFDPDVLFFAGGDQQARSLMASVAVKTNSVLGNHFLGAKELRPAGYWGDTLTAEDVSVDVLLQRLKDMNV